MATVRNRGNGPSTSTTLRYYRSPDTTIDRTDTEVDADTVIGLAASGASSESKELRTPSSAGTYYYGACVDSVSGESDAGNNCSSAVRVTAHPFPLGWPDLKLESPSVSDSTPDFGGTLTFKVTVRNRGKSPAEPTNLLYYRAPFKGFTQGYRIGGTHAVVGLPGSGSVTTSKELDAPTSNYDIYYYGACVVPVPREDNTVNNCSSPVQVRLSGSPPPDLVIESASVNKNPLYSGESFVLRATVANQGTGLSAETTVRFYHSSDATISTTDEQIGQKTVQRLSASSSKQYTKSVYSPRSAGTYYYGACVDSVLLESDTGNNCSAAVAVKVLPPGPPDLVVVSPRVSDSTPAAGGTFKLTVAVRNEGTGRSEATTLRYYRSSDSTISAADTPVGTDGVGSWAPSEGGGEQIELTAPLTAGTYYYGACVDPIPEEVNPGGCSSAVEVTVSQ